MIRMRHAVILIAVAVSACGSSHAEVRVAPSESAAVECIESHARLFPVLRVPTARDLDIENGASGRTYAACECLTWFPAEGPESFGAPGYRAFMDAVCARLLATVPPAYRVIRPRPEAYDPR